VDDIESYGDANTPDQLGGYIWYTWKDGLGYTDPPPGFAGNETGSSIGNWPPPVAEQSIVHSDMQSMPFYYNNSGSTGKFYYSETTANVDDLVIGPDWTRAGAKALTLYFYGNPENDANSTEQMYVKLNGAKILYDGDMSDIREETWHTWNIELASFGVDLLNITEISIGFGNESNKSVPGGSGIVYFDNIRLYPSRCVLSQRSSELAKVDYVEDCVVNFQELELMSEKWFVTAAAPSSGNLVGHWKFDGNANDSSGSGTHGTVVGDELWVAGQIDNALELGGRTHVVLGSGSDLNFGDSTDFSVALWIKTTGWQEDAALISNKDWMSGSNTGWVIAGQGGGGGTWQWNYSGETGSRRDYDPSGPELSDGKWHHLCVAHDRDGDATFYFDGEFQAEVSIATSTGTIDSVYPTVIGQDGSEVYSYGWFEGVIDDVRIYNSALTGEQVLYFTGIPVDLNDDNKVDLKDFAALADAWLDEELWPQ
jgi:hypothetical protein